MHLGTAQGIYVMALIYKEVESAKFLGEMCFLEESHKKTFCRCKKFKFWNSWEHSLQYIKSFSNFLPGQCNIVVWEIFAKFAYFENMNMAAYSARFLKSLFKKNQYVKFKKQNVIYVDT